MAELAKELEGVIWGRWHEAECNGCGQTGHATRTEAKPAYVYYCGECETWELAERQFDKERTEMRQEIADLRAENERLKDGGKAGAYGRYCDMIGL